MKLSQLLQKSPSNLPILQATFGLERESLRINHQNRLAQTPHPAVFGSRNYHPYIQTDYSEAQLELITPIAQSTQEVRRLLGAITKVAQASLHKGEYLWPLSMPPHLTEQEIHIAHLEDPVEYRYRQGLADRYGKLLQSMSGIHYNMELGKDLTDQLFAISAYSNPLAFKNDLYLKLAQNFLYYRWLLTYLYGATPLAEKGFLASDLKKPVRSLRNSSYGYVNHEDIHVSFASLEQYISDLEGYVQSGQLSAEKEFYSAVRLRGSKFVRNYLKEGIQYLEFRSFDLNPFDSLAISQETIDTVHLFVLSLLWMDDLDHVDERLHWASELNETIALAHPLDSLPPHAPVQPILSAMTELVEHFQLGDYYADLVETIQIALNDPTTTVGGQLYNQIEQGSLEKFSQSQGKAFHQHACTAPYALKGYENMELSTQMLLIDVIQKGIHFEILDENDQFLKLWHGNHVEYVKNGNMTSKDNYIVPLAMANKTVTKKILDKAGFPVPAGSEFSTKEAALRYYRLIADKPIVIKPKSTNFGLGISIFQEPASLSDYEKALNIAFLEDKEILVEEFIAGTEYRFFILDGKCEAVLLRVAANVIGDGKQTIRELIAEKNNNPLRGNNHRFPLEVIHLGEIELLMLEQQGYTPDTVLPVGVTAYLRGNSNISTGGDSIDMTEKMDTSYKQLAADMACAIGAWVCGVDLIIPDRHLTSTKERPNCTCIELNFNPSMYMHTYCHEGPGQIVTRKILDKLFPEI